jgi:hypothetical protein
LPILDTRNEFDADIVGLSGTAILPSISTKDIPFSHPFGFDWEFFVAPDPQYTNLLAPSNTGRDPATNVPLPEGGEFDNATQHAISLGLSVPRGVLGVETDQDLVPPLFRAQDGDRVAVFGRWIVDAGHSDFHSEIHPPLLLASARGVPKVGDPDNPPPDAPPFDATTCRIIGRPYLVSQEFGDGALREHLFKEATKVLCPGFPVSAFLGNCSLHVEAHPRFMPKPFSGIHLINIAVSPPQPRRSPNDKLIVSFHFTVRTGVAVQVIGPGTIFSGTDAVGVIISMNDVGYTGPPLPTRQVINLSMDDLGKANPEARQAYEEGIITAAGAAITGLTNPAAAALLAQGVTTDRYSAPVAASPRDSELTITPATDIAGPTPFSVDDGQPFPVYGFITVEWNRDPTIAIGGNRTA